MGLGITGGKISIKDGRITSGCCCCCDSDCCATVVYSRFKLHYVDGESVGLTVEEFFTLTRDAEAYACPDDAQAQPCGGGIPPGDPQHWTSTTFSGGGMVLRFGIVPDTGSGQFAYPILSIGGVDVTSYAFDSDGCLGFSFIDGDLETDGNLYMGNTFACQPGKCCECSSYAFSGTFNGSTVTGTIVRGDDPDETTGAYHYTGDGLEITFTASGYAVTATPDADPSTVWWETNELPNFFCPATISESGTATIIGQTSGYAPSGDEVSLWCNSCELDYCIDDGTDLITVSWDYTSKTYVSVDPAREIRRECYPDDLVNLRTSGNWVIYAGTTKFAELADSETATCPSGTYAKSGGGTVTVTAGACECCTCVSADIDGDVRTLCIFTLPPGSPNTWSDGTYSIVDNEDGTYDMFEGFVLIAVGDGDCPESAAWEPVVGSGITDITITCAD